MVSKKNQQPEADSQRPRGDGCGFMLGNCLFACLLLILNGVVVTVLQPWIANFFGSMSGSMPSVLNAAKITQIAVFGLPVLLVFVEWWLWDLLVDLIRAWWRRRSASRETSESQS